MTNRITNRRIRELAGAMDHSSLARAMNHSTLKGSVDAATAATKTAHGRVTMEARRGLISARASETASRVSLAQVVDSVAIEVKALLGRMRLIAHQGATGRHSFGQYELLQQEFEMLQDEMAQLVSDADRSVNALDVGRSSATFHDISPTVLKIDRKHARVDSKDESDWALFRLDSAEDAVVHLTDEFGTIDDRLDAALNALDDFIQSVAPSRVENPSASEAMTAALRTRLQRMQSEGVDIVGASPHFQRSISALLQ